MSSSSDIIELINSLLEKSWAPEEMVLLTKLSDNLLYYKKLIPKALKTDIVAVLTMANSIKSEYDVLKGKLTTLNPQDTVGINMNTYMLENVVEVIQHSLHIENTEISQRRKSC
jgi:hypothetical protein